MCEVVNIKCDECDVPIHRGTKWGNPYSHKTGTLAKYVVGSRKEAIEKYENYLINNKELMKSLPELVNKKIGCFCKPKSCHGDILKKYVDNLGKNLF